ncbi:MAG: hypothetical protein ACJA1R_001623 [Flavobacteriales bacterium]|jgi:hypothetical protein
MPSLESRTLLADYDADLRAAYSAGEFEESREDTLRCGRFAEGTFWFPYATELASGAGAVLPMLGGVKVIALMGAIVGFMDGHAWAWAFVAVLAVFRALVWKLTGAMDQKLNLAIDELRVGVFLRVDNATFGDGKFDRVYKRQDLAKLIVHSQRRHESLEHWLLFVGTDGQRMPTDLQQHAENIAVIREWLGEEAPDVWSTGG